MNNSYFDGKLSQIIGWRFLGFIITFFSFGICYPWAVCMVKSWEARHTVINGNRMKFNGTPMQLFGTWIKWWALTIVTCGIYAFWLPIKSRQWVTCHTSFSEEERSKEAAYENGNPKFQCAENPTMRFGKKDILIVCTAVLFGLFVFNALFGDQIGNSQPRGSENSNGGDEQTGYLLDAMWALGDNYMFAVEVDGFDGDVFQSGTFDFYPETIDNHKIQAIYDVYVGSEELSSTSDVIQDCEYIGAVGGTAQESITVNLNAGSYVYVIFNEVATGEHGNVLHIENTSGFGAAEEGPFSTTPEQVEQESNYPGARSPVASTFAIVIAIIAIAVIAAVKRKRKVPNAEAVPVDNRAQMEYSNYKGMSFSAFVAVVVICFILCAGGAIGMFLTKSWWSMVPFPIVLLILGIVDGKV